MKLCENNQQEVDDNAKFGTEEEFCAFLRRVCNPKAIKF